MERTSDYWLNGRADNFHGMYEPNPDFHPEHLRMVEQNRMRRSQMGMPGDSSYAPYLESSFRSNEFPPRMHHPGGPHAFFNKSDPTNVHPFHPPNSQGHFPQDMYYNSANPPHHGRRMPHGFHDNYMHREYLLKENEARNWAKNFMFEQRGTPTYSSRVDSSILEKPRYASAMNSFSTNTKQRKTKKEHERSSEQKQKKHQEPNNSSRDGMDNSNISDKDTSAIDSENNVLSSKDGSHLTVVTLQSRTSELPALVEEDCEKTASSSKPASQLSFQVVQNTGLDIEPSSPPQSFKSRSSDKRSSPVNLHFASQSPDFLEDRETSRGNPNFLYSSAKPAPKIDTSNDWEVFNVADYYDIVQAVMPRTVFTLRRETNNKESKWFTYDCRAKMYIREKANHEPLQTHHIVPPAQWSREEFYENARRGTCR